MPTVFISHASADHPLANELFDLLQLGCDLPRGEVSCTSVDGAGIEVGEDFVRWIQAHLATAPISVLLITPNYLASRFCLAEMGAAWALEKAVFPLVLPNHPREVGGVLLGRQTVALDAPGLDALRDHIARHHKPAAAATGRWNAKKGDFLRELPELLARLPAPPTVTWEEYQAEVEKSEGRRQIYEEVRSRNRELEEYTKKLEGAKDAEAVAQIKREHQPLLERYESLVRRLRQEVGNLSRVEVRAVLASIRDEPWKPSDWDTYGSALSKATQSEWIRDVGDDWLFANDKHPRLRPIFQALGEMDEFLKRELPPEEKALIEEQLACLLDISNRQYWEEVLCGYQMPD